jgi:glycosyltransferase involved in cell wall biosynthesis
MRILHVFRTPVGGLFRHVRDLARGQQALGHQVGVLCDSQTGGETANKLLKSIETFCDLGIKRIPVSRMPGFGDVAAARETASHAKSIGATVIHGHGAKGGLYGRLAGSSLRVPSVYTPHGGSLHYKWLKPPGMIFLAAEKYLLTKGSGLVFVCDYERLTFAAKLGLGTKLNIVVHNGLWPEEFRKVEPMANAADLLFIGDMRDLKGVDILLDALKILNQKRRTTLALVGDGPDMEKFKKQADDLRLGDAVTFVGRLPTAEALRQGRLLVMPSRNESFPYVILEAAAGQVPIIASRVGGIPEILPDDMMCRVLHGEAFARHIDMAFNIPEQIAIDAKNLATRLANEFSAKAMAEKITSFYGTLTA